MPISKKSLPSVLPHGVRGNNSGCLNGIRVTLRNGLVAPNKSDLSSRRYRHNTTEPIFMNQGAQEGMDVTYSFLKESIEIFSRVCTLPIRNE
jgi:hypothetical protein